MHLRILLLLFLPAILPAQSSVDSLLLLADRASSDSAQIAFMISAAEKLLYNDPDRSYEISLDAIEKSKRSNLISGMDASLSQLAAIRIVQGNYAEADKYIDTLLSILENENLPVSKIRALNRRAVVQYYQGRFVEGIETNLTILGLAEKTGTKRSQLNALNNIGINYERLLENDKAIEYYQKALVIAQELNIPYLSAAIFGNIAVIYKNSQRLEEAEELFLQSIGIAEEINNQTLLIDELSNLTDVYIQKNELDYAVETNDRAMRIALKLNDKNGIIKAHTQEGRIKFSQGLFSEATLSFLIALDQAQHSGDKEELLTIYDYLHKSLKNADQPEDAYEYLTLYSTLRDSIFNIEKTNELSRLETLYQVTEKDKEILSQELELERRTKQRNYLVGGALVFLSLGLISFFFLRRIIRANKKIAAQTQELQQKEINRLENEKKVITLDAMVMGQEEERGRIAKDLHDSLGSLLATIKGHSSALQNEFTPLRDLNNYQKTNHLIDEACDEVRRISHNMMPMALISNGLVDALRDLTSNYASTADWEITFDVQGMNKRLPENYELMIFRIIQELMANIARHAMAQNILFQMILKGHNLHITVEDDGRGFKLGEIKEAGLGMRSIKSRVEYLSGEVEIDSVPGEGTTVLINIPIKAPGNSF